MEKRNKTKEWVEDWINPSENLVKGDFKKELTEEIVSDDFSNSIESIDTIENQQKGGM